LKPQVAPLSMTLSTKTELHVSFSNSVQPSEALPLWSRKSSSCRLLLRSRWPEMPPKSDIEVLDYLKQLFLTQQLTSNRITKRLSIRLCIISLGHKFSNSNSHKPGESVSTKSPRFVTIQEKSYYLLNARMDRCLRLDVIRIGIVYYSRIIISDHITNRCINM